ncbi:unnamed protein product [Arabis nemorensis]|uniref:Uncharacterized protein n=1 Tax=Arabis nemorensis TaxID=586526 RepID=A0A565AP00_9BRAS|nr:unnamed protein product [Arabis nemorensis]
MGLFSGRGDLGLGRNRAFAVTSENRARSICLLSLSHNHLEWTEDLEVFILKGYGNSLNYKMGFPLLEVVLHSMEEEAIKAREEKLPPGSYKKKDLGLHMSKQ